MLCTQEEEEEEDPDPILTDSNFLKSKEISLEEFQDVVTCCHNDYQLSTLLRTRFNLPDTFIIQALRRAVASNKIDLLNHILRINSLLPPDSLMCADDDQILQLMQKAVTMEEKEAFQALLPHLKDPERLKTKMELQSLVILAAQFSSIFAVHLLCVNYRSCLEQTIQGKSVFIEVARASCESLKSALLDLLEMGIYVNTQEPDGNTALHITTERGNLDAVKLLLSKGACPTLPNAHGKKAVDLNEDPELVSLLQEASALSPSPQEVSLYHAAEHDDLKSAQKLLQEGIPVDSKWIYGRTALAAAAKVGSAEMVDFFLSIGASLIPLGCYWPELPVVHAMHNNHRDIALNLMHSTENYFIKANDIEKKHIKKQLVSLLHYCAQTGATAIANLILSSRYRIDPNTEFRSQLAPIHIACRHGQLSMVKLLLLHNSRADLPSEVYCNTPLHYACFYGHTEVAQFLLSQPSVSVNCKNIQHESPLYCVLRCQLTPYEKNSFIREASVIFLLSRGASLIKPGRRNCELREFTLDVAAHRWQFVPLQTQKLIVVIRDEGRSISLASEARLAIRGALQAPVSEDTVGELGLPFRLQKYVLLRDWFPT